MAKWQPPIPAGALWSAEAVSLGPALALLAWCYDAVQRDGTFTISIAEAGGDLNVEYRTIKRWWSDLRTGPFFHEVTDKGRRGFAVRFADTWLDWRVLNARQSNTFQGSDMAPEDTDTSRAGEGPDMALETVQVPVKSPSRASDGPDMALGGRMYKVLQTDQKTCIADDAQSAPPPHIKARKPRAPKAEPDSPSDVRAAIAKGSAIDLAAGLKADILQVNKTGAHLWRHMRRPDQDVDSFVADIRYVGKWIRKTQHPYKDSEQRIPPSALIKFWAAAMEARPTPRAALNGVYLNGQPNGAHPPLDTRTPQERAAEVARMAQQIERQHGGGGR